MVRRHQIQPYITGRLWKNIIILDKVIRDNYLNAKVSKYLSKIVFYLFGKNREIYFFKFLGWLGAAKAGKLILLHGG